MDTTLSRALREFMSGQLKQLLVNMSGENGDVWETELKKFNRREPCWVSAQAEPIEETIDATTQLASWVEFYKTHFGLTLDPTTVPIPREVRGFDRLIAVAEGVALNKVVAACCKHFNCWLYNEDLDHTVTTNDRAPTQSYSIWVRDRIEADKENKNLSANMLAERGIKGQTLLERLLHEFRYFSETGKHLDIRNCTLCSGSRYADGNVPRVDWAPGSQKLYVDWYYPDDRSDSLRARSVVS